MTERAAEANLFESATRLDRLEAAWERVRTNAGCAGADGVTVGAFVQQAASRLLGLRKDCGR